MLWLLLKIVLVFIVIGLTFVCVKHFRTKKKVQFYVDQGMSKLRGSDNFLIGSVSLTMEYETKKQAHIESGDRPWKPSILWSLDQLNDSRAPESYDAGKNKNVVTNLGGNVNINVGDPKLVQEILVTKNALVDKTNLFEGVFIRLFGKAFVFS